MEDAELCPTPSPNTVRSWLRTLVTRAPALLPATLAASPPTRPAPAHACSQQRTGSADEYDVRGRRWMDCIGRLVRRPSDWEIASQRFRLKKRLDVHEAVIVTILQRVMDIIDPPALPPQPRNSQFSLARRSPRRAVIPRLRDGGGAFSGPGPPKPSAKETFH